jgi:hypothetical protein
VFVLEAPPFRAEFVIAAFIQIPDDPPTKPPLKESEMAHLYLILLILIGAEETDTSMMLEGWCKSDCL